MRSRLLNRHRVVATRAHWTLCQSCSQSQVIEDDREHVTVYCHFGMQPLVVSQPVTACSEHEPKGRMSQ